MNAALYKRERDRQKETQNRQERETEKDSLKKRSVKKCLILIEINEMMATFTQSK